MAGTRHEEYGKLTDGLPFVLNTNLKRTFFNNSEENNWHDDLEIQLCTEGSGMVWLDGKKVPFNKNDIVVVNSNVIHYTGTATEMTYSCMIVSSDFCKKVGLAGFDFSPLIQSAIITEMFQKLVTIYSYTTVPYRIARLNQMLLNILLELAEHHSIRKDAISEAKYLDKIKATIVFIRKNYNRKITLDEIARAVLHDKYNLCRKFKNLTGQTIVQNINNYRCIKAIDYLNAGYTVAQAASLCGFENLSFFTETFKKYTGRLPSSYK